MWFDDSGYNTSYTASLHYEIGSGGKIGSRNIKDMDRIIYFKRDGWEKDSNNNEEDEENENGEEPLKISTISLAGDYCTMIKENGSLWIWGREFGGNVVFVPKKKMSNVKYVNVQHNGVAAVKTDDSLWTWGHYTNTAGFFEPQKNMDDVTQASVGDVCAVVKKDGSLWTWGSNLYGQLGIGSDYPKKTSIPQKIMEDVTYVSVGSGFDSGVAAIKKDGSLWTWGCNAYGVLGRNTSSIADYTPEKIMDDVASVDMEGNICAALKKDGSLWVWGPGSGSKAPQRETHYKIMDDVSSMSVGFSNIAAIKKDGSLWIWGSNFSGQLGNGKVEADGDGITAPHEPSAENLIPKKLMDDVKTVSVGSHNVVVIKNDGSLWAWGGNEYAQLGDETTEDRYVPTLIWSGEGNTEDPSKDDDNSNEDRDNTDNSPSVNAPINKSEEISGVSVVYNSKLSFQGAKFKLSDMQTLSIQYEGVNYTAKKAKFKMSKEGTTVKMTITKLDGGTDKKIRKNVQKILRKNPFTIEIIPYEISSNEITKLKIKNGKIKKLKINLPSKNNFNAKKYATVGVDGKTIIFKGCLSGTIANN